MEIKTVSFLAAAILIYVVGVALRSRLRRQTYGERVTNEESPLLGRGAVGWWALYLVSLVVIESASDRLNPLQVLLALGVSALVAVGGICASYRGWRRQEELIRWMEIGALALAFVLSVVAMITAMLLIQAGIIPRFGATQALLILIGVAMLSRPIVYLCYRVAPGARA